MALTKRARRRIFLLLAGLFAFGGIVAGLRQLQDQRRASRAEVARELGMEAVRIGDWETALSEWSLVVAQNKNDIPAILLLAEARSQVPSPENKHLQQALNLFLRAEVQAEETNGPEHLKIDALEGRGRMEAVLGQLARLQESSRRLLELDPTNDAALGQLLAVSEVTGNLLPVDPELLVRGDRSTGAWLQAMRGADDASSLRWLLESFVKDPRSSDMILKMMSLLERGDSESRQEARVGSVRESRTELLKLLAEEYPELRTDLEVLEAREWLAGNQVPRGQELLSRIEIEEIRNSQVMLLAAAMYKSFGTPEGRAEANRILNLAASGVGDDIRSRIQVASQLWHLEQPKKSIQLVDEGLTSISADAPLRTELLILGCQLNLLNVKTLSEDRRRDLESALTQRHLSPEGRSRIQLLLEVADLRKRAAGESTGNRAAESLGSDLVEQITELCGNFSASMNAPLMLCILADLAVMAGLDTTASAGFEDALAATGGMSAPISRRLITSYAMHGALLRSFRSASRYLRQYPTRYAATVFADAWINLEKTGLNGIDYEPWIAALGTPSDFLRSVQSEGGDEIDVMTSVLARSLDAEGDEEAAREVLLDAMEATDDLTKRIVLLATMSGLRYEIPDAILDAVEGEAKSEEETLEILRVKLAQVDLKSGPGAALSWLESEVPPDLQPQLRRQKGMLEFRRSRSSGKSTSGAFETLLSGDVPDRDLPLMMRLAVEASDRASAERVFRLAVGPGTERLLTPPRALAVALFVVNFDIEDSESLDTAIRVLDPLVASGNGSPELEFLYAQVLRNSGEEKTTLAIEMLRSSVSRYPERYATALLLCEMLQDTIQFEEAGELLRDLTRRTGVASEQQQVKLSLLLSRQGETAQMVESICDLAARSGKVANILQCIEAKRLIGEIDEANRLLDELSVRVDRTAAVDILVARRMQVQGDVVGGLEYLERSRRFSSDAEQVIAIAEIASAGGEWEVVVSRLRESAPAVDESAKAQLLLAGALLEVQPPDPSRSVEALRRAVDAEPADRGVLRRAALIAISSADLVESREYFLDRLESVDAAQADLLRLGIDFNEAVSTPDSDWESLEARSAHVLEGLPRVPVAWNLRIDVLSEAIRSARQKGDPDALERYSEILIDEASDYAGRFPGQAAPLSRQTKALLQLGKPEEAVLVARASIQASVEAPRLGIVVDLALAEFQLGNYQRTLDALADFSSRISAEPTRFQQAWNLMYRSLLLTGKVQEARGLYVSGPVTRGGRTNWESWVATLETAEPQIALEAAGVVMNNTTNVRDLLTLSLGLKRLFQSGGDPAVQALTEQLDERIEGLIAAMEDSEDLRLLRLQMAASSFEITASSDPRRATLEGVAVFNRIPRDSLLTYDEIDGLPSKEREFEEAIFAANAIFLNNLVVRAARVIDDGVLSDSEAQSVIAAGEASSTYLLSVLPQNSDILDSVADFKLAVGDSERASELIRTAIEIDPSNAGYHLTDARILLAQGRSSEAAAQANRALRLTKADADESSDLVMRIMSVIQSIEGESGG